MMEEHPFYTNIPTDLAKDLLRYFKFMPFCAISDEELYFMDELEELIDAEQFLHDESSAPPPPPPPPPPTEAVVKKRRGRKPKVQ